MEKSTQYWLWGCGCGCALVLVGIGLLLAGGAWFVRDTTRGFEEAIESRAVLEERFGETEDFVPPPDAVAAERIEAFLAVREATAPAAEKLAGAFAALPGPEEAEELDAKPFLEKMREVAGITRSAVGLGADIGNFFEARNRALLDQGMGLGEYSYLYVVAYYGLLGHDARDSMEDVPMPNVAARRLSGELRSMLHHQLDSLPAEEAPDGWRERLAAELATLEEEPRRLPWADGLPEPIAASLEPFRERLEASYRADTNPFELGRNRRRGRFSIQAE